MFRRSLLLIILLLLLTANQSWALSNANQGVIEGTVVVLLDIPLSQVSVSVRGMQTGASGYATTDFNGYYRISGLPSDDYVVSFRSSSTNYIDEYYNNRFSQSEADLVSVVSPNIVTVNAELNPAGKIQGKVTAKDTGLPLANIVVSARLQNSDFYAGLWTNDAGEYTLAQLPEGTYILSVYPSSPFLITTITNIYVGAGQILTINPTVERGAFVSGRVFAEDTHAPLSNVQVSMVKNTYPWYSAWGLTDATGAYTLSSGLPTGTYRLSFEPTTPEVKAQYFSEYYDNKYSYDTATPIVISDNGVYEYDAYLDRGVVITTTVTASDTGLPLKDVAVSLHEYTTNTFMHWGWTNDAGEVQILARPDVYHIYINPSSRGASVYLPEYYNNQQTLAEATPFTITNTLTPISLTVQLDRGTVISGTITANDTGLPLKDVAVYSVDESWQRRVIGVTDSLGHYTSSAIPAGQYRLHFQPFVAGYKSEYYSNTVDIFKATVFSVPMSDTFNLNVDAQLDAGNWFTGKITAREGGYPLSDVYVDVYDKPNEFYFLRYRAYGVTDATGTFTTTPALEPGTYYLKFLPYDEGKSRYFVGEYYNQKAEWNATPIEIATESGMHTINATLRTSLHVYLPIIRQ